MTAAELAASISILFLVSVVGIVAYLAYKYKKAMDENDVLSRNAEARKERDALFETVSSTPRSERDRM